jgi:uncharacterized protein
MAKASLPGRTKTRLMPPLSAHQAAALNTAFLRDTAANLEAASELANVSGWMAFTPAGSERFFREILPPGIGLIETVAPNFGDCLFHAAATLLTAGHHAACVLNSDSPTLPVSYLLAASAVLSAPGDRVVLGPSTDGGYYLLGIKHPHRRLFDGVDWSTDRVARQTKERAAELGLEVVVLPTWYDVDDLAALRVLIGELIEGRSFRPEGSCPTPAKWTRAYLATLLGTTDLSPVTGVDTLAQTG